MDEMSSYGGFRLDEQSLTMLSKMYEKYDDIELNLVSDSDVMSCPYCRNNGCYGACTMSCSE